MSPSPDTIEIRRLKVSTHIGVPDEERAHAQDLWISVVMTPSQNFDGLHDCINFTIDYQAVANQITALAAARPRNLIESLAVETTKLLLGNHPLQHVAVTVEKQILPDTDCVVVRVERSRQA